MRRPKGRTRSNALGDSPVTAWHDPTMPFVVERLMTDATTEPATFDAAPSHPEEIRSEFDLRVGKHITLQGRARITPAGLICSGLAVAMVTIALGYLARSIPRRRW